jgi:adenine-specific DNA methylase
MVQFRADRWRQLVFTRRQLLIAAQLVDLVTEARYDCCS